MHFFSALASIIFLASSALVQCSCSECPLNVELAVTGTIRLGKPLAPISIPGGQRTIEPIIGGDLSGAINATIKGGLAYPEILVNGTVDIPQIIIYGTTEDNSSFLIQEDGIGKLPHQNTRINLEVGGKAAPLMNEFIVASVVPSKDRKTVAVKGYIIPA